MAAGGSLAQLAGGFAAASLALGALLWRGRHAARDRSPVHPPAPEPDGPRGRVLAGAGLALGLASGPLYLFTGDALLLWWWLVALLGAAGGGLFASDPLPPRPAAGPSREAALLGLAGSGALLALASHRPDIDDAFYVNLAAAAAAAPHAPVLQGDTLHGIAGLPLHLPVYRLHSYELASAALSGLTGLPAIACFHLVVGPIAAFFVPLAHARLLRLLQPRTWLATTAALMAVLIAAGEPDRWYGNFAFVRIWQGKSIFLFVFLPLVYAYACEFALRPGLRRWLLLAAAQIAAVGCSSSALWAGPAAALAGLCAAAPRSRGGARALAAGAAASLYVLSAGWLLKSAMAAGAPAPPAAGPGPALADALREVLGEGALAGAGLAALGGAWACCGRGLARRFAVAVPLAGLLVLLNPYAVDLVRGHLIGPYYWRALWSLPLPLLMALLLVSPLQHCRRRAVGGALSLGLLLAFAVGIPSASGLGPRAGVSLRWPPELKVPEPSYGWAARLAAAVPPGAVVVAPPEVSRWVGTFRRRVHPLEARPEYLFRYREQLGADGVAARHSMTWYAAGRALGPNAAAVFRRGLARFRVEGVCLRESERAGEARRILRAAGFRRSEADERHEIWIRS